MLGVASCRGQRRKVRRVNYPTASMPFGDDALQHWCECSSTVSFAIPTHWFEHYFILTARYFPSTNSSWYRFDMTGKCDGVFLLWSLYPWNTVYELLSLRIMSSLSHISIQAYFLTLQTEKSFFSTWRLGGLQLKIQPPPFLQHSLLLQWQNHPDSLSMW